MSKPKASVPYLAVNQIGHDSEFFLWDTLRGEVVPSYKYYKPQSEAKVIPLRSRRAWKAKYKAHSQGLDTKAVCTYTSAQQGKIYRDGLAVEVGIDPVTCRAFFWNDTRVTLLRGEPSRMPKQVVFTTKPWVPLTKKMIDKFPEDLRVLGCSPSLDAYAEKQKTVAVDPLTTMFRTSGTHLHMSFSGYNTRYGQPGVPEEAWGPFIKLADLLIGVPFTYVFGDELERARRKLYGQAGEFRYQPAYGGLEYRVLSSRLWNHQATCGLFTGIWKYMLGGNFQTLWNLYDEAWADDIQQAINEVDVAKCGQLLSKATALMKATQYRYTIGPDAVEYPQELFTKLRELNLRGFFPDAGVWSRPFAPDAHAGWNDYVRYEWELMTKPAAEIKDRHYGG